MCKHRIACALIGLVGLLALGVGGSAALGAAAGSGPLNSSGRFTPTPTVAPTVLATPLPIAWSRDPAPNPGAVRNFLRAVAVTGSGDQWAVGFAADSRQVEQTLILHGTARAWTVVPSPNVGQFDNYLYGIGASGANDLWAVGYTLDPTTGYQPLILHGNGTQWNQVPAASAGPINQYLYAVTAIAPNDAWAVGQADAQLLLEHWNGTVWTIVPGPDVILTRSVLYAVTAIAPNDIWAVGERSNNGTLLDNLALHWDGRTWSDQSTGLGGGLRSVTALAADDVWAVGYQSNQIATLTAHWDGTHWTFVPSPNSGNYSILRAVAAASPTDIWAAGVYNVNDTGLRPFFLHWDGTAWTPAPGALAGLGDNDLYGLAAVNGAGAWAVGNYRDRNWPSERQTLIEHACPGCGLGTATPLPTATLTRTPSPDPSPTPGCIPLWGQVPSPNQGRWADLLSISGTAADDLWAVGYFDDLNTYSFTMHWDGSQWSTVPSPSGGLFYGVAALAPKDVWAVGGRTLHWDGHTWTVVPNPGGLLYGVAGTASNNVWAVGFDTEHWDGSIWRSVPRPPIGVLNALAIVAPADIWATGAYCVPGNTDPCRTLIEHWDGHTWQIVPSPSGPDGDNDLAGGLAVVSANDIWAAGSVNYRPLLEHWDGSTWQIMPSPPIAGALRGSTAAGPHDIWVVSVFGQMAHWDGTGWTPTPRLNQTQLNAVFAVTPQDVWAVGHSLHDSRTEHYSGGCVGPPSLSRTSVPPTTTSTAGVTATLTAQP